MAGKSTKMIQERLAKKQEEMRILQGQISLLEDMLKETGVEVPTETPVRTRAPRSHVKNTVLNLLKEVGASGLNAAIAVDAAAKKGTKLERGSVSSLLSRLKEDGVVTYDGDRYKLKEFEAPNRPSEDRGGASIFSIPASRGVS